MAKIITFGEALFRLSPPGAARFEQAGGFDLEIGGAELNTAAGLVRLGHVAAWVSRRPDSPLGDRVQGFVRSVGVDDRHVIRGEGRQGIYYLESGAAPRASAVIYDRADSSMARLKPGDFHWPAIFAGADWFHVSGITAALSRNAADAVKDAITAAKKSGAKVSVDLNYRAKLWNSTEAGRVMSGLIGGCDLLFASEHDAKLLFDLDGEFGGISKLLHDRFGVNAVATTRRESQSLWRDHVHAVGWFDNQQHETKHYDVEVVDRIGSGDAFAAGVIDGMLRRDFVGGLETGAAMAALAHTVRGDLPLFTRGEVDALMAGAGLRIRR